MSATTPRQDAEDEMIDAVAAALGELRGTARSKSVVAERPDPVFLDETPDAPAAEAASIAAEQALTAAPEALQLAAEPQLSAPELDPSSGPADAVEAPPEAAVETAAAASTGEPYEPGIGRRIAALERFRARLGRHRAAPRGSLGDHAGPIADEHAEHRTGQPGAPEDAVTFRLLGELDRLWHRAA